MSEDQSANRGKSSGDDDHSDSASSRGQAEHTSGRAGGSSGRGSRRETRGSRRGGFALFVALVALIAALAAAAGAGYLWYRGQQRLAALHAQIGDAAAAVQQNVQQQVLPRESQLSNRVGSLSNRLDALDKTESARSDKLKSLAQRLDELQSQNNQLQAALGGDHEAFVEQRILALLEAANQRLEIYHDPDGAAQALKLADQAIAHAGYPQLHPVRADIASEMDALNALARPDIESVALQLSQLAARVPSLPMANNVPTSYHNHDQNSARSTGAGAQGQVQHHGFAGIDWRAHWDRMIDALGNALSHMVTLRSASGAPNAPALMSPNQSFFLVQNLQLELRMARLALLEHRGKLYHSSLAEARTWISRYFNTGAPATKGMLSSLKQLSQVQLEWQAPDISASLSDMRRIVGESADQSGNNADDKSTPAGQSGDQGAGQSGGQKSEQKSGQKSGQQTGEQTGQKSAESTDSASGAQAGSAGTKSNDATNNAGAGHSSGQGPGGA